MRKVVLRVICVELRRCIFPACSFAGMPPGRRTSERNKLETEAFGNLCAFLGCSFAGTPVGGRDPFPVARLEVGPHGRRQGGKRDFTRRVYVRNRVRRRCRRLFCQQAPEGVDADAILKIRSLDPGSCPGDPPLLLTWKAGPIPRCQAGSRPQGRRQGGKRDLTRS